mgnify:CR=1 FL=1
MQASSTNIVVDVGKALSRESGVVLVGELVGLKGVSRAWVSPRASRMLLADYDPAVTNSRQILGAIRRHGFDARLVGM